MAQLVDIVRNVENLYSEKLFGQMMVRKEKVAYLDINASIESELSSEEDESEIDVAELKLGPPYVCKVLNPCNSKDISKITAWSQKVYGFDITKADMIFDVLMKDK
jgi:hypothetical protein